MFAAIWAWIVANWLWLLLGLIVLVVLLVLTIPFYRRWRMRRKALRDQEKLRDDLLLRKELAEVAQGGESGAAAEDRVLKTRLADLRTAFADGYGKLADSEHGVYGLPWLLVLGEPGAGKSEFLRKSGLHFPADLVDPRQGQAGTEYLHWWISESGVAIDLAGRILFARWGSDGNAEWRHLLALLRRRRRHCPLNGVILTIPADSLIADADDLLARKAALLADELSRMHRALGLLVPTWVVVTKSDRVLGFREATEHLSRSEAEAAFGWRNQDASGAYDPRHLEAWFAATEQRLEALAAGAALRDEAWEEGRPHRSVVSSRLDAFPSAFRALADSLDRYLGTVFTGSGWATGGRSILQGVWFTSALDDGGALDAEMARARGTDVEELGGPLEPAPERRRFVVGLLAGIVLPATGTVRFAARRAVHLRRPWWLLAATAAVLTGFMVWTTVSGWWALRRGLDQAHQRWLAIDQVADRGALRQGPLVPLPGGDVAFADRAAMPGLGRDDQRSRRAWLESVHEAASTPFLPPVGYRLAAFLDSDWSGDLFAWHRQAAYRLILSGMLTAPAVAAARTRLLGEHPWQPEELPALVELLHIELGPTDADQDPGASTTRAGLALAPLLRLGLQAAGPQTQARAATFLRTEPVASHEPGGPGWTYDLRNPLSPWFGYLGAGTLTSARPLEVGVRRFNQAWSDLRRDHELPRLLTLSRSMEVFADSEERLLGIAERIAEQTPAPWTQTASDEILATWQREQTRVAAAARALAAARNDTGIDPARPFAVALEAAQTAYEAALEREYQALLGPIAERRAEGRALDADAIALEQGLIEGRTRALARAAETVTTIRARLARLASVFADGEGALVAWQQRVAVYGRVDRLISRQDVSRPPLPQVPGAVRAAWRGADEFASRLAESSGDSPPLRLAAAVALGRDLADILARRRAAELVVDALDQIGRDPTAVAVTVADLAQAYEPWLRPTVPLTELAESESFPAGYHPEAAATLLTMIAELGHIVTPPPASDGSPAPVRVVDPLLLAERLDRRRDVVVAYERSFVDYWCRQLRDACVVPALPDWRALHEALQNLRSSRVLDGLQALGRRIRRAVAAVPLSDPEAIEQARAMTLAISDEEAGFAGAFAADARSTLAAWRSLPGNADEARNRILALGKPALAASLLAAWRDPQPGLAVWWNSLVERCFELLVRDARRQSQALLVEVERAFARFPLVREPSARTSLDREQVERAAALLGRLRPGPAKAVDQSGAVALGGVVEAALARLRDPLAEADGAAAVRLQQMAAIASALVDAAGVLSWAPVAPGPEIHRRRPRLDGTHAVDLPDAAAVYRYVGWRTDPQSPPIRQQTIGEVGGNRARGVNLPADGRDLTLLLYRFADDHQPEATVVIDGTWSAIGLVLRPGTEFDAETGNWYVPLLLNGVDGEPARLWVGLRFDRDLPPLTAWPIPRGP